MKRFMMTSVGVLVALAAYGGVWAQVAPGTGGQGQMSHEGMHQGQHPTDAPAMPGQDAFGAIQEIVRLLEADPNTDWSRVDLERLRQHLIDMNEVVLRAAVKPAQVPGGLAMDITGAGQTRAAIRAMVIPHAAELDKLPQWTVRAEPIAAGVRLTVIARDAADATTIVRIRGLSFAGLLAQGGHHGPHHLAMAKGELSAAHRH
ncbi:MAG TPA: hypothetical protein VEW27_12785 [Methylomirabilota bacterium]|nr:hypothetical protein [Methylomirabilota bacterium]